MGDRLEGEVVTFVEYTITQIWIQYQTPSSSNNFNGAVKCASGDNLPEYALAFTGRRKKRKVLDATPFCSFFCSDGCEGRCQRSTSRNGNLHDHRYGPDSLIDRSLESIRWWSREKEQTKRKAFASIVNFLFFGGFFFLSPFFSIQLLLFVSKF